MADIVVPLPTPAFPPLASGPPAALNEASLGRLLGALASRPGPVPKYRYPSAGTLYPVQAYLVLRHALDHLEAGSYYHDPEAHALVSLSDATPAAPDATTPAALLVLVAQRSAIEPIYGARATSFCLLEAGYMTEALLVDGARLKLREAGEPVGNPALAAALLLQPDHLPLVCWAVGESGS
jgi:hypothetical protein